MVKFRPTEALPACALGSGWAWCKKPMGQPMSWSELERLVEEAEAETSLQRARQLDCRAQPLEQRLG